MKSIVTQLISTGKAQHALLGVSVQDRVLRRRHGQRRCRPAAARPTAGVKAGDVITAVDGTKVTTAEKLRAIIAAHKPGDSLTLERAPQRLDEDAARHARLAFLKQASGAPRASQLRCAR